MIQSAVDNYHKQKMVLSNGGLKTLIIDTIKQQFTALVQLPSEFSNFLEKANNGEIEVQVKNKEMRRLYALGQQFMLLLTILTLVLITQFSRSPKTDNWTVPVGVVLTAMLLYSVWKNRNKRL